jgi:hypothetical protein
MIAISDKCVVAPKKLRQKSEQGNLSHLKIVSLAIAWRNMPSIVVPKTHSLPDNLDRYGQMCMTIIFAIEIMLYSV